jgi:pimeloyl-ACP methyl ester carboxylesterase
MGDAISSLLFQPPPPTYLHPSRHFWLNTALGSRIPAFFIERPNAQVTILFSHGNAEDLGMIYDWFNDLSRVLRVNIMAYDYTGYGKSNGAPTEENCYADIESAYQYLLDVRGLQPEQIVLYGRSLGSGPSCYLASKTAREGSSVGGVILQSPLLSAYRVAFDFRFTMVGDKVRPIHISVLPTATIKSNYKNLITSTFVEHTVSEHRLCAKYLLSCLHCAWNPG